MQKGEKAIAKLNSTVETNKGHQKVIREFIIKETNSIIIFEQTSVNKELSELMKELVFDFPSEQVNQYNLAFEDLRILNDFFRYAKNFIKSVLKRNNKNINLTSLRIDPFSGEDNFGFVFDLDHMEH